MYPRLAAICVYPVKSCAANELESAQVEPRGLTHDRRWMLVDDHGRFVTGRQLPRLVQVRATPQGHDRLRLEAPGMALIEIAAPADAQRIAATVWDSAVSAADAGPEAARWFSDYLGRPVRLVHADAAMQRPLDLSYGLPGDEVGFADGYPLLALSRAATDELSARAGRELGWRRFRPNLLIDGVPAHAEDAWRRVRIGMVEFDVVKPCVRCVFTTIDPDTGVAETDGEPLTTLKGYRRGAKGITFGQNLIARGAGAIRLGDPLEVLSLRA
ncbi:MAG TPA: MOSC domain-containing protein [Xanthomonadales bacterium]|nr:MOSC domain-containing protein [Xanthomonadales bacterium]